MLYDIKGRILEVGDYFRDAKGDMYQVIDLPTEDPEKSEHGILIGLVIGVVATIFGGTLLYKRHNKKMKCSGVNSRFDRLDKDDESEEPKNK